LKSPTSSELDGVGERYHPRSASCTVYYYSIAAVPALIAVATMKETARKPLA